MECLLECLLERLLECFLERFFRAFFRAPHNPLHSMSTLHPLHNDNTNYVASVSTTVPTVPTVYHCYLQTKIGNPMKIDDIRKHVALYVKQRFNDSHRLSLVRFARTPRTIDMLAQEIRANGDERTASRVEWSTLAELKWWFKSSQEFA